MSGKSIETVRGLAISREWRALHALYCVGAVSARIGGAVFFEFGKLVTEGYANPRANFPANGRTTYTLTSAGRTMASALFSLE